MFAYYRIHSADEPTETVLNPRRPDGWVASDEHHDTQPLGVSCCSSLADLARYIDEYGMSIRHGDLLLRVWGHDSGEPDRDAHAVRVIAQEVEVIGDAGSYASALMADIDDLDSEIINYLDGEDPDRPTPAPLLISLLLSEEGDMAHPERDRLSARARRWLQEQADISTAETLH